MTELVKFRFIEVLAAKPHPLPLGEVAALKALTERAVSTSYTLSVTAYAVPAPPEGERVDCALP